MDFDWHKWRTNGVGSSDVACLMGIYKYKTPYKLYMEKRHPQKEKQNFIFKRGHQLEKAARAQLEIQLGFDLPAMNIERESEPYMRCSMDMINLERDYGIECKYVGEKVDSCPPEYYAQIQYQYLVTGLSKIDLCLVKKIKKDISIELIEVPRDLKYCHDLYNNVYMFWHGHILDSVPPVLINEDAVLIKDKRQKELLKFIIKNKDKLKELEKIKDQVENAKTSLSMSMDHGIMRLGKTIIYKHDIKGDVNYRRMSIMEHLKPEYIDAYRDADLPTISFR